MSPVTCQELPVFELYSSIFGCGLSRLTGRLGVSVCNHAKCTETAMSNVLAALGRRPCSSRRWRRQQAHADGRWHRHGQLAGLLALTERDDLVIILIGDKSEQSHLRRPFFLSARALATLATLGLGRARERREEHKVARGAAGGARDADGVLLHGIGKEPIRAEGNGGEGARRTLQCTAARVARHE